MKKIIETSPRDIMIFGMPAFFFAGLMIMLLFILTIIIFAIKQWRHNNSQPVIKTCAKVISKRMQVSGGHESSTSTHYYAAFETETALRIEFAVKGADYGLMAEQDTGILTYQGTRYLGFQRNI